MKIPRSTVCIALLAASLACRAATPGGTAALGVVPAASRAHEVYPSRAWRDGLSPATDALDHTSPSFDFQTRSPAEFLDFLVARQRESGRGSMTIWGTHRDWIRAEDIPALLDRLDSDVPCLAVCKAICSNIPLEPSTEGREAAHLIEAYRAQVEGTGYGGYPSRLHSLNPPEPDPEGLRAWWTDVAEASG